MGYPTRQEPARRKTPAEAHEGGVVELNYGRMMQRAMQRLVAEALSVVSEHGLPGEHHFYITFQTSHPGVDMPSWLHAQFPSEMVIVLQHQFSDLAVTDDRFSVRLSFSNRPATLVVPFDAVLQFADPSAEFGLRFDALDADERAPDRDGAGLREAGSDAEDDGDAPAEPTPLPAPKFGAEAGGPVAEGDRDGEKSGGAEVVDLNAFRKK